MMLLRRGWRLLRYSFFTSISFRIFSLLVRHSLYFSASLGEGIWLLPHTIATKSVGVRGSALLTQQKSLQEPGELRHGDTQRALNAKGKRRQKGDD